MTTSWTHDFPIALLYFRLQIVEDPRKNERNILLNGREVFQNRLNRNVSNKTIALADVPSNVGPLVVNVTHLKNGEVERQVLLDGRAATDVQVAHRQLYDMYDIGGADKVFFDVKQHKVFYKGLEVGEALGFAEEGGVVPVGFARHGRNYVMRFTLHPGGLKMSRLFVNGQEIPRFTGRRGEMDPPAAQ